MEFLFNYLLSFISKARYNKRISLFAIWDRNTKFDPKIYIAMGVRMGYSTIGKYSRVRHFTVLYHTNVGKFSAIGKNVRLGVGQHPINLISTNLIFYKKNQIKNDWVRPITFKEYKKIEIGNDVWIGEGAMVMGGVVIGDGAIVASRSVVTKDVPPYAIVAGVPAKVVKYRFCEEIRKKLLQIKWWDLPEEEINKKLEAFTIFNISKDQLVNYFE